MSADSWQAHVARAAATQCIGDLLLLADEAPQETLRAATLRRAAQLLQAAGQDAFAAELRSRANPGGSGEIAFAATTPASASVESAVPRQVLLFSGHMIDGPDRTAPRFPAAKVPQAAQRIADTLAQLDAGPLDVALTQGACGGDLLFSKACLQRGVRMFWLQPFEEPRFLDASVRVCGGDWHRRYIEVRDTLVAPPRAAPAELGPPPQNKARGYAYERCNLWLLYTALAYGPEKLHLICLWNGENAEGAGGTGHMIEQVNRHHGRVTWIDTRTL